MVIISAAVGEYKVPGIISVFLGRSTDLSLRNLKSSTGTSALADVLLFGGIVWAGDGFAVFCVFTLMGPCDLVIA